MSCCFSALCQLHSISNCCVAVTGCQQLLTGLLANLIQYLQLAQNVAAMARMYYTPLKSFDILALYKFDYYYYYISGTSLRCCIGADRHSMFTYQVAALCCVQWHHGHHLESVTSNQKSNSVNQCVFTLRRICVPNFIPILVEMTKP